MDIAISGTLDRNVLLRVAKSQTRALRVLGGVFVGIAILTGALGLVSGTVEARREAFSPVTIVPVVVGIFFLL